MIGRNRSRLEGYQNPLSDEDSHKMRRGRSQSRVRPIARTRSKSRAKFEVRDAPEETVEDEVNKFVHYKKFGLYATEISRVIAIDEIPEVQHSYQVVVKVKVSRTNKTYVIYTI
jgi:hypothetical protein